MQAKSKGCYALCVSSLAAFFSMKFAKAMVYIPLLSSAGIAGKQQPTEENRSASPARNTVTDYITKTVKQLPQLIMALLSVSLHKKKIRNNQRPLFFSDIR